MLGRLRACSRLWGCYRRGGGGRGGDVPVAGRPLLAGGWETAGAAAGRSAWGSGFGEREDAEEFGFAEEGAGDVASQGDLRGGIAFGFGEELLGMVTGLLDDPVGVDGVLAIFEVGIPGGGDRCRGIGRGGGGRDGGCAFHVRGALQVGPARSSCAQSAAPHGRERARKCGRIGDSGSETGIKNLPDFATSCHLCARCPI